MTNVAVRGSRSGDSEASAGSQADHGRRLGRMDVARRVLRRLGVVRLAAEMLAAAGVFLAVSGADRDAAATLLVSAALIIVARGIPALRRAPVGGVGPTGSSVLARTLLAIGFALVFPPGSYGPTTAAAVVFAILAETVVAPIARLAVPYAQNLPGISVRNRPLLAPKWVFAVNTVGLLLFAGGLAVVPSDSMIMVVPAVQWSLVLIVVGDAASRIVQRLSAERRLGSAVADYAPTFLLHWYAPVGSMYQATMWLPYLERLGRPFVIVVRNPATFVEVAGETSRPVIVRRYGPELTPLVVPSLRTVFYVNTSPRNEPMLAFLDLQQVQLNHGDSDKAPSYRRSFRVYDKNFVSGQAAIDRFARHGVDVPTTAFEIVGRPQVESITVAAAPIARQHGTTVLYAPTWFGYLEDSRYSSLLIGGRIVTALLRRGCTVIFRPHPWSWRNRELAEEVRRIDALLREDAAESGRTHVFGPPATRELTLVDCFNRARALVADISSVVPDFLYSEKPFALTAMHPDQSVQDFVAEFPLARGGYLLRADGSDWQRALDDLLLYDPKLIERRTLKTYYLGPFPTDSYAEGFLSTARRYV